MGKGPKQTPLQRRYTDDKKAPQKMFDIMSLGNDKLKQ